MSQNHLLIRKYKNRRLYDTERSCFVTREEILSMVRSGRDVRVEDVSSGEDTTGEVLLQLIVDEQAGAKAKAIPPDFLHFLIRANRNALAGFFQDFLPNALKNYQTSLLEMHRRQQQAASQMLQNMQNPFTFWQNAFQQKMNPPAPAPEKPASELDELKAELDELKARLGRISGDSE